jgi:glutamine cyclotransferase
VEVASSMARYMAECELDEGCVWPDVTLALGDNFYTKGVQSWNDTLWDYLWKDIYLKYEGLNNK